MVTDKKYIPRGPAATAAKNKYKKNNYDRKEIVMPRGAKQKVEAAAERLGYLSANAFIVEAIREKYQKEIGEEL